jgi:nucleotide-binding universal stress UspA family protein
MTRPKKILLSYDGSPDSKEALQWAIELSLLSCARWSPSKWRNRI